MVKGLAARVLHALCVLFTFETAVVWPVVIGCTALAVRGVDSGLFGLVAVAVAAVLGQLVALWWEGRARGHPFRLGRSVLEASASVPVAAVLVPIAAIVWSLVEGAAASLAILPGTEALWLLVFGLHVSMMSAAAWQFWMQRDPRFVRGVGVAAVVLGMLPTLILALVILLPFKGWPVAHDVSDELLLWPLLVMLVFVPIHATITTFVDELVQAKETKDAGLPSGGVSGAPLESGGDSVA